MFEEVKAEISELVNNAVFVRNLSVTLLATMAISCGLAELQSQDSSLGVRLAIANNSNFSSIEIIMERK